MTTTAPSTVLATIQPAFTDAERLALAAVHHRRVLQYAAEEELLDHSPAAHVRRPRVDYESRAVALDRNELGALLVAAGLGPTCRARADLADLAARAERTAGLGGYWCRYRAPWPGARAPDSHDHAQGREGGDYSAGAADSPGDGPGHRRTDGGAGVPSCGRSAAGPARRRAGCPQGRPPRRGWVGGCFTEPVG